MDLDRFGYLRAVSTPMRVPPVLLWLLVLPGAVWALARTVGLEQGVLAVQLMAFTPYVAAASLIPLVVALLAMDRTAARVSPLVVAVLSCAVLAACVLPRAFASPVMAAAEGPTLTVMAANLREGGADARVIVDLVRTYQVDVLTLQEYTPAAEAALAAAGLTGLLPHSVRQPVPGTSGSAVYARLALTDTGVVRGYWFFQAHATVQIGQSPVVVESVHPPPPVSEAGAGWAQALREQVPAPATGLRILAGDFNATLDHAELRRLIGTGYRDAASSVGAGFLPTWSYYGRRAMVTPKVTIDHILVNGSIRATSFGAYTVPNTDHRAIIATLTVST